jgi:TRAP-type C4-dicarboxylate transport system permease small subunit
MRSLKKIVLQIDRYTTGLSLHAACVLLVLISLLGLWQVAARFVFEQPSSWTEEAMRRLLIWMVMLGTVAAFRQGALVSVDLMLRWSVGRWQRAVRWIITAVHVCFLVTVLYFGVQLVQRVQFQTFASMALSMSWAYGALPVGALLGLVAVIAQHLDPRSEELEMAQ